MVDLFNFDFSEDVTEEKLKSHFEEVQLCFKYHWNSHLVHEEELPHQVKPYISDFIDRGWLKSSPNNTGYDLPDEYVMYHSADEVIELFRARMYEILEKASEEDFNYYDHMLPAINSYATPVRIKNAEVKQAIEAGKQEIVKDITMKLGLEHFLKKPKSRGMKMQPFETKWAKDNVLPIMINNVQIIEESVT